MAIIIDAYNLIGSAGIITSGVGPGGLERARLALLNFLAESLDAGEVAKTTVVFDAKDAPAGLPRTVNHRGLVVRFAARYPDADSLIEELIGEESAPRSLTVVSSDHRIQRAARRRKATPVDSDVWYNSLLKLRSRRKTIRESAAAETKPPSPLLSEDVDYWLKIFGGESLLEEVIEEESASQSPPPDKTEHPTDTYNPFPPGYGEDIE